MSILWSSSLYSIGKVLLVHRKFHVNEKFNAKDLAEFTKLAVAGVSKRKTLCISRSRSPMV